ncbi:MAG: hypothetical protein HY360_15320 [Verrucomicrobia bacterium]|nr:hypothetical protein [Verrucomicrobiota bacterium]
MTHCLADIDLLEVSKEGLASFERRIAAIPPDLCAPFHEEARQLETELLTAYRFVVLAAKKEDELDKVARWWAVMVQVCDEYAKRLNQLTRSHPTCGAELYYDHVLDLRSKCLRLQKMHC